MRCNSRVGYGGLLSGEGPPVNFDPVISSPAAGDPLDQLVHLSHLIGRDLRLVQPGGGNTSTKDGDTLLVKGSGTDLGTISRDGFTRLSLSRLTPLRHAE
jgi:rhamnose utilization protein RhaD (predicted bifunctional aldolase and dehydrogenase)